MKQSIFVSRGGIKLQHALERFAVPTAGLVALDVGSSTGGFVDCLLKNGALRVYSLDTAYGELAWKLRNDPRVVLMERTNVPVKVLRSKTQYTITKVRDVANKLTVHALLKLR